MRKFGTGTLLVLAIVFAAVQVQAFDGQRQGFMLNLGAGLGQGKLTGKAGSAKVTVDAMGFGGDFKIGGGLSPQTVIYYSNRTLFYSPSVDVLGITVSSDVMNGMSAIGISHFLEPQAPSVFFSGAIGIGVYTEKDADSESGLGFTLGVGWEFMPNWTLEATYMGADIGTFDGVDMSISTGMISISWFAY